MQTKRVEVELGPRSYDVVVGDDIMSAAGAYLQPIVNGRRVALVSDEQVLTRYLDVLAPQLDVITPQWYVYTIYAEIMKYALLSSEAEYSWLEAHVESVFARHPPILIEAIRMTSAIKANIVSEDELDKGKRAFVNLGHTFAHAFETHAGYGRFPHGHAVAVGVIAACKLSEQMEVCAPGLTTRVQQHIRSTGLPASLNELCPSTDWQASSLCNRSAPMRSRHSQMPVYLCKNRI